MNIKYFPDTDTALLEFSEKAIEETRALSENVYVDLDAEGNVISMTIEHAKAHTGLPNLSMQEMEDV